MKVLSDLYRILRLLKTLYKYYSGLALLSYETLIKDLYDKVEIDFPSRRTYESNIRALTNRVRNHASVFPFLFDLPDVFRNGLVGALKLPLLGPHRIEREYKPINSSIGSLMGRN